MPGLILGFHRRRGHSARPRPCGRSRPDTCEAANPQNPKVSSHGRFRSKTCVSKKPKAANQACY